MDSQSDTPNRTRHPVPVVVVVVMVVVLAAPVRMPASALGRRTGDTERGKMRDMVHS